jgi:hypothetical protein
MVIINAYGVTTCAVRRMIMIHEHDGQISLWECQCLVQRLVTINLTLSSAQISCLWLKRFSMSIPMPDNARLVVKVSSAENHFFAKREVVTPGFDPDKKFS